MFSDEMYACQVEKPAGTAATPVMAMEIYAKAAQIIETMSSGRDLRMEKRKCAVSKEVISKPTKAQGARMIRLKTA